MADHEQQQQLRIAYREWTNPPRIGGRGLADRSLWCAAGDLEVNGTLRLRWLAVVLARRAQLMAEAGNSIHVVVVAECTRWSRGTDEAG